MNSVMHIGANEGQERYLYRDAGVREAIYVEPLPDVFQHLQRALAGLPGHIPLRALCSDLEGETLPLNVASNGGKSSSIYPLGRHAEVVPSVYYKDTIELTTTTVDAIWTKLGRRHFNLLVVDTQGSELKVLRGAKEFLHNVDCVSIEVSKEPLYDGGCTFDQLAEFLVSFDFELKWSHISRLGWGDAVFLAKAPAVAVT